MVRDSDTTIYLFGTFHLLDGRMVKEDDAARNGRQAAVSAPHAATAGNGNNQGVTAPGA